ncbi:hypothetical protein ACFLSY_07180, partial [Bacteroidota bacterium]
PERYKNKSLKSLPSSIDNSELPFFRPVFNQYGWSCNQSASIGYLFTYEMNFINGTSADIRANQYPFFFTWNFLNDGLNSVGTSPFDSWEIIKNFGCPTIADFENSSGFTFEEFNEKFWLNGYDYYYNAMKNRIEEVSLINVSTPDGLQTLKQWLNDHLDGSQYGGVANFQIASGGWNIIPADSVDSGLPIVLSFGEVVGHSMTFVGYDDNVQFDYNQDGQFTNDIDTNNDGIVDMRDWEIGAMITVNSWGAGWWGGSGGKVYTMYRLLAEHTDNGGIWNNTVQVIRPRIDYEPKLTMKVRMSHNQRDKIKISAGVTTDLSFPKPEYIIDYPIFNYQGGENGMVGYNGLEEIEIGLDISPLLSYIESGQDAVFYLIVDEAYSLVGSTEGTIHEFSIINYDGGVPREFVSDQTEVPINFYFRTTASVQANVNFEKVNITTESLPMGHTNSPYISRINAEGGEPPYKWTMKMDYDYEFDYELMETTGGEKLSFNDENHYGYIKKELDFSFPFYNQMVNTVYVNTDGALVLDENIFAWPYIIDEKLPLMYNKAIVPFGTNIDIYPNDGDGVFYSGDANRASFRWNVRITKVVEGQIQSAYDLDFEVRLYPNGEIVFLYKDFDAAEADCNWVGGISNGDMVNYQLIGISNSEHMVEGYKCLFRPLNIIPGVNFSEDGLLMGYPELARQDVNLEFVVTDKNNISDTKILNFKTEASGIDENSTGGNKLTLMPNPVSDRSIISFTLNKGNMSELCLFNNEGKLVQTVLNEYLPAGQHEIILNARDNQGKKLPAGIYHLNLISGKQMLNTKLVLI